jgi:DNA adenine methylase
VTSVSATPTPAAPRRQHQLDLVEGAGPIVKWAGGKSRLINDLLQAMPPARGRYLEPFVGGGALLFELSPTPGSATIGDTNGGLVDLYVEIARDPVVVHALATELFMLHADRGDGFYYEQRARWNSPDRESWSRVDRAAGFLYLSRACFNGLWRENRSGLMNVPVGRSSSGSPPRCPSLARLVAAGVVLRGCEILRADYRVVLDRAAPGDLVYLDPPYEPRSSSSSFTAYTAAGFGPADQDELAQRAVDLVGRGVSVLVSMADVPGTRERYPGFAVREVTAPRSISARSAGRARVGELVLIGGYSPIPPPAAPGEAS